MGIGNLYDPINLESAPHPRTSACARTRSTSATSTTWSPTTARSSSSTSSPGRVLAGRRWSDGLHQAVEAKENVRIQEETRTMATITFQNLFRLYKKLAGMTGTADTEATEFHTTYKLERHPDPDEQADDQRPTTRTSSTRPSARSSPRSIDEILECHENGQPVLVGTTSVEKSNAIATHPQEEEDPARRPEREAPRERGVRRRAGRAQRRDHRLAPTWPVAGRTSSSAATRR